MTREELKIRTQQAIDAIPVLRWRDDGWEQIDSILYEILTELDGSDWHTGTPTEEGFYLVQNIDGFHFVLDWWDNAWYDINFYYKNCRQKVATKLIVAYQKIEPYKEKEDGHTD